MRHAILPLLLATAACAPTTTEAGLGSDGAAMSDGYDLQAQYAKLAVIEMNPDTSYLTEEERQVVNLLIDASSYMDEIYLRQRFALVPSLCKQPV